MKYLLVTTAHHGGGIISRHPNKHDADQAKRRWLAAHKLPYQPACECGCVGVVNTEEYTQLPSNMYDPVAFNELCRP